MTEKNWSGNVTYSAERIERPKTVTEAQELIAAAEQVRVVGTRHSFTRIADSAVMLDATSLPEFLEIAADRSTVRVNAGMTYGRLAEYLNVTPDEVNFGPSTSQNVYVLANAFRAGWSDGDEIIVTNQE